MSTLIIEQKQSNSGSIHDAASDMYDRVFHFRGKTKYAIIWASYYGDIYSMHETASGVMRRLKSMGDYSHIIIDREGTEYKANGDELIRIGALDEKHHICNHGMCGHE